MAAPGDIAGIAVTSLASMCMPLGGRERARPLQIQTADHRWVAARCGDAHRQLSRGRKGSASSLRSLSPNGSPSFKL